MVGFPQPSAALSDCVDPSVYESGQFKPDSDGQIFLLHPDEVHGARGTSGARRGRARAVHEPADERAFDEAAA